ncbi:uncharacterized protein CIMG_02244 [Coccidioides immitis RS]|uniref:Aminoglycoside phosphotransferase domain-containing protein n=1 Tax=Coccidioides immitis (strain RS) TaxID=246410 RepID=A0A0E1RZ38_COCIM|nr:uncharacterized protein CIMG_02244 [Coccidioides immitis RS]EAS36890.2 hypothetical protein CIMG_02244 [Coccidioides immitis RS]TPX25058.1 hypothetical protein DIZ76_010507 [Coccidioides immitis]
MFSFLWHYCSAAWAGFRQFVYLLFYFLLRDSKYEIPDDIEATSSTGLTSTTYNMEEAPRALTLPNAEAAQWNRDILLEFKAALEKNPAVDLISMFSDSYHREHLNAQYSQLSYAARINLRTLTELHDALRREPEVNLLSAFPTNYTRRITMATGSPALSPAEGCTSERRAPEFRTRLELAETASVIFPLSEKVTSLLAQSGELVNSGPGDTADSLFLSLKKLLWDSTKLWENPVRGVVVKCNENIIAKVITGNKDYTEYTSLEFLAKQAPDVPAPRPHGLVAFGPFRVIFMSCIPGMTLTQAWPSLSHEEKLSIQGQLDEIFRRLRILRQDDGNVLGGVCGEGVKELRVDECALFKGITTAIKFNDLQFSAHHHGSSTYVEFLRSFLRNDRSTSMHESVFTHGDVRTDNIMVKQDPNGRYIVTGIIDWEYSGFYPEYYECTGLTRTLSLVDENDWYLYLPESISPSQFPVRWLVDRLWGTHLRTT